MDKNHASKGLEVQKVLQQYPIAELRVIELMEASNRNENYLVKDNESQKYVLRGYRRWPRSGKAPPTGFAARPA